MSFNFQGPSHTHTHNNTNHLPFDGQAPPYRTRMQNWPTILFSWWCTSFAAAIILTRIVGRKVRSNVLFREDWIMLIALIPLFARMILIHFVLVYGTNNVDVEGQNFTDEQIEHMSLGSKLVLAARICYAAYIWLCKLTVSEFLKRITIRIWRRRYQFILMGIRGFLLFTFVTVVLGSLCTCRPFRDFYQVIPSPKPLCRLGYVQLLTMASCDIMTDMMLVLFPIPLVMKSGQKWRTKVTVSLLFSLSVVLVAVTGMRMILVIQHRGNQQYRSLWASCEILAAAAVSNAVILGSFVRDKGTKKNRYKSESKSRSEDRNPSTNLTLRTIDSDEDLFQSMGYRIPAYLQDEEHAPRPAPPGQPAKRSHSAKQRKLSIHTPPPNPREWGSHSYSPRQLGSHSFNPMDLVGRNFNPRDFGSLSHDPEQNISTDSMSHPFVSHIIPTPSVSTQGGMSKFGSSDESYIGSSGSSGRLSSILSHDFGSQNPADRSRRATHVVLQDVPEIERNGDTPVAETEAEPEADTDHHEHKHGHGHDHGHEHPLHSETNHQHHHQHHHHPHIALRTSVFGALSPRSERRKTEHALDFGGAETTVAAAGASGGDHHDTNTAMPARPPIKKRKSSPPELQDVGGLLSPTSTHHHQSNASSTEAPSTSSHKPHPHRHHLHRASTVHRSSPAQQSLTPDDMVFQDIGGLMK